MGAVQCVRLELWMPTTCEVSIDASQLWELAFVRMYTWSRGQVLGSMETYMEPLLGTTYHPHTMETFGWRDNEVGYVIGIGR